MSETSEQKPETGLKRAIEVIENEPTKIMPKKMKICKIIGFVTELISFYCMS